MAEKRIQLDPNIRIKTEPGLSEERLASFKVPRDLTLGGSANRAKKIFTPNLNVARNRNKSEAAPTTSQSSRGSRGRGRGGNQGARGRGRGKEFIQSQGVFSEGVGGDKRRTGSWSSRSSGGGGGGTKDDGLDKPKVNFKEEIRVDKNEENRRMQDIFQNDSDYVDLQPDTSFAPITLTANGNEDFSALVKVENNFNDVKEELKKEFNVDKPIETLSSLLETDQQKFIFFQFPDSLPALGKTTITEPELVNKDKKQKTDEESTTEPSRCSFRDLEEGLIGRIVMYKSGRTKLLLGTTEYNLELGMQRTFLQDVMSIDTDPETKSGKMINLGQIEGGIVISPDWRHLLNNVS